MGQAVSSYDPSARDSPVCNVPVALPTHSDVPHAVIWDSLCLMWKHYEVTGVFQCSGELQRPFPCIVYTCSNTDDFRLRTSRVAMRPAGDVVDVDAAKARVVTKTGENILGRKATLSNHYMGERSPSPLSFER